MTVSFRDLNLDHPEGVAALYARIHVAAATVCTLSGDAQPSKLAFIVERNKCIDHAVAKGGPDSAQRQDERLSLAADRWMEPLVRRHPIGRPQSPVISLAGKLLEAITIRIAVLPLDSAMP